MMKALIRDNETYTEDQWSDFTRNHLNWMCGQEKDKNGNIMPGDGWTLVENYIAPTETEAESYDVVETVTETEEETVTINGVTYTKSQLRALLGE